MNSYLKKVKMKNVSGISEQIEINFEAGRYKFFNEYKMQNGLVNPLFLYGRNACGKTSILKTLLNLRELMIFELQNEKPIFMPNFTNYSESTNIELEIVINGKEYFYELEISFIKNEIKNERIVIDQVEYKRETYNIEYGNLSMIRFIGREKINVDIALLYTYLKNIDYISTNNEIITKSNFVKEFTELIYEYSNQITKYSNDFKELPTYKLALNEEHYNDKTLTVQIGTIEAPYDVVLSSGTKSFHKLVTMLCAKQQGTLLVIDEIDNTIHPTIISSFIKHINEHFDIQILCSSHNLNLLKTLRPDQVYFCKNDNNVVTAKKVSELYPEIREIHNIETLYLGGRFD